MHNPLEMDVLRKLNTFTEPVTIARIHRAVGLEYSYTSIRNAIRELEDSGFIEREKRERSGVRISLNGIRALASIRRPQPTLKIT